LKRTGAGRQTALVSLRAPVGSALQPVVLDGAEGVALGRAGRRASLALAGVAVAEALALALDALVGEASSHALAGFGSRKRELSKARGENRPELLGRLPLNS